MLSRRGAKFLGAFAPVKAMGYRHRYWYVGKVTKLAGASDSCVVELLVRRSEAEILVYFRRKPDREAAEDLTLSATRVPAAITRADVAELIREFDALAALGWGNGRACRSNHTPAVYAPLRERFARRWSSC